MAAKNENPKLSDAEREELAPDAGGNGAPHLTPNKEQLAVGADKPEKGFVAPRFVEAQPEEEVDPIQAELDRIEERHGDRGIPNDLQKVITDDARLRFADVVLLEGERTVAPGRYRNVDDLDEVVEVQQDAVIPDGLRLISDQYLVAEPNRTVLLGRRLRAINA